VTAVAQCLELIRHNNIIQLASELRKNKQRNRVRKKDGEKKDKRKDGVKEIKILK
jgi:hypothetical protein